MSACALTNSSLSPNTRLIDVSTKNIPGAFAIVDDDIFSSITNGARWTAHKDRSGIIYVCRHTYSGEWQRMHRIILGASKTEIVDHINGNGLDNRQANLRFASFSENLRNAKLGRGNTSGFKGVFWSKKCKHWFSKIYVDGKSVYLGSFQIKELAASAYDMAAKNYYGDFARTNADLGLLPRAYGSDKCNLS